MATVIDKSGNTPHDDNLTTPNRTGTATPQGSAVPQYAGELFYDTTNEVLYRAYGTTNADWLKL